MNIGLVIHLPKQIYFVWLAVGNYKCKTLKVWWKSSTAVAGNRAGIILNEGV